MCCHFGRLDQVEDWIVLKVAISWEMTTDAFWYACLFAGKSFAMQLWQQNFCKIYTIFGPQNGGWKMDPKMVPEFDPQNEVQKCGTHVAIKICCHFGRLDQVEDWIVLKDAISWEMTTDAFWYACLFAGKSFAMQLWQQNFCKICTIFGPQNGGWKMDPKMVPEFDPQNGVQKWHPKGGSNILLGLEPQNLIL